MKKYRLLTPLIGLTIVGSVGLTTTLVACNDPKPTPPKPASPALCFTADGEDSAISYAKIGFGQVDTSHLKYSYDGIDWIDWRTPSPITLNDGQSIYVWNENTSLSLGEFEYFRFEMTGKIAASGNVNSMINYGDELTDYCFRGLFINCDSLIQAPELPAKTLAEGCYADMFYATSITAVPELPATTLADYCYRNMFHSCSSLSQVPELPATTLAEGCYESMFASSSLSQAPELPAKTLTNNCYDSMFAGCESLTTAPDLLVETLAENCCQSMFSGCSSLTTAPELLAETLADGCYNHMFSGCSSLTTAPELPAETLAEDCYSYMFSNSKLICAPELPATTLVNGCYNHMFEGCTKLIIGEKTPTTNDDHLFFTCPDTTDLPNAVENMFLDCPGTHSQTPITDNSYSWLDYPSTLCFTAVNGPATVHCTLGVDCNVQYSFDKIDWYNLIEPVSLENEQSLYLRNTKNTLSKGLTECFHFILTGQIAASGNINSMINYAELSDYCFCGLFEDCVSLVQAPELPATTLAQECYERMFYGTSITTAPELPATTLAEGCYSNMFNSCESLTNSPELPATTLANQCYSGMFEGCTSLTTPPELPAKTCAKSCYFSMFNSSAIRQAPELPATTLAQGCYSWMFASCPNLTTSPKLPAETCAKSCYEWMFGGCPSLTTAGEISATTVAENCCASMFQYCSALTTAPKDLLAETLAEGCYYDMFYECTSLTTAPEIHVTTLADHSCSYMFYACLNLELCYERPNTSNEDEKHYIFTCPDNTGLNEPVYEMFMFCKGVIEWVAPQPGSVYYWIEQ